MTEWRKGAGRRIAAALRPCFLLPAILAVVARAGRGAATPPATDVIWEFFEAHPLAKG